MLSTRVKLTAAFVAGLIAVTATLFLAVLTARNNAVYHDIAQYAAAQGDLAARVILDAAQSGLERVRDQRYGSHPAALAQARRPPAGGARLPGRGRHGRTSGLPVAGCHAAAGHRHGGAPGPARRSAQVGRGAHLLARLAPGKGAVRLALASRWSRLGSAESLPARWPPEPARFRASTCSTPC